jgi:hypothetical protein
LHIIALRQAHAIAFRRFSLDATCASAGGAFQQSLTGETPLALREHQRSGSATQTKPADPGSFYASLKRIGIRAKSYATYFYTIPYQILATESFFKQLNFLYILGER